jgi:hypothetical protein
VTGADDPITVIRAAVVTVVQRELRLLERQHATGSTGARALIARLYGNFDTALGNLADLDDLLRERP